LTTLFSLKLRNSFDL